MTSKLREIQAEKDEIERLKKNRNKSKLKKGLPAVPTDGFSNNSTSGSVNQNSVISRSIANNSISNMAASLNEPSEFDLEESEFNNIDKNEQKEIYQFKQKLLENEERRIREELQLLEKEK